MVMGSGEDERCFSNMGFVKSKFRNRLTTHLDLIVRIFTKKFFTFDTFPFAATMNVWNVVKSHHTNIEA